VTERAERRLGEVVGGKYKISRFLAAGGMGSVYEAQHTVVKRRFAVKFLHPDLARKRDLLTRFQREAEAAGALESENVAAAIDFGVTGDGSPYIVLEYLGGLSLDLLLEAEGTLPAGRATELVQQACRGVQAAHALGIVHRDLKPHNLFVCRREDGTDLVKVLDFGVAKLEALENSAVTRTGTVLGTPSYMSPEQARGEKSVGQAADVYALGAILYELLSGKKPHPGASHNAILHHISTQPAVPLASAREGLPEGLVAVVEQALAGAAEARPASAEVLGRALAPWVEHRAWPAPNVEAAAPHDGETASTELAPPAPPAPSGEQSSGAPSLAVASLEPTRESSRPQRPPRLFLALAGLALLLALGVFLSRGNASPPEPADKVPVPETLPPAADAPPREGAAALPAADPTPPASLAAVASPSSRPLATAAPASDPAASSGRPAHRTPSGAANPPRPPSPHAPPVQPGDVPAAPAVFDTTNPYH
jgi:serine/threonine protein kinase